MTVVTENFFSPINFGGAPSDIKEAWQFPQQSVDQLKSFMSIYSILLSLKMGIFWNCIG